MKYHFPGKLGAFIAQREFQTSYIANRWCSYTVWHFQHIHHNNGIKWLLGLRPCLCVHVCIQAWAICHTEYFNICLSLLCYVDKMGWDRREPRVRGESSCSWWKLIIKSLNQPPLWHNLVVQILDLLRIAVNQQNLYIFVMNLWSVQKIVVPMKIMAHNYRHPGDL